MAAMTGSGPICPACGQPIDIEGPAVSSYPRRGNPDGPWTAFWVPFVEDIRFTPTRLVHAECYAIDNGLPALIAVVHERDRRHRIEEYERHKQALRQRE